MTRTESTIDSKFKTTATRSAALLIVNLLFIAEFGLDGSNYLHLSALICFAFSIPLLLPSILMGSLYESGSRFESANHSWALGPISNGGGVFTGVGIGIAILSIHWLGLVAYLIGLVIAFMLLRNVLGIDSGLQKSSSTNGDGA